MSKKPIPLPRKGLAPNPPAAPRQQGQSVTGNVTVETEGPEQKALAGSDKSSPPRPPPPQLTSSSQEGKNKQDKTKEVAKHLDTVRTEDETTKKSFGKPRKNPPTHDTSSYLFEGNKTGDASQPSATAEQLNTIGGGSKQDSFSQGAITGMVANQSQRSEEERAMTAADDLTGQGCTKNKAVGDMGKSFLHGWNKLQFEIRSQGQNAINFDATDLFRPPALLQFALTSEQHKAVSFDQLNKQNIHLTVTSDCLIFTFNIEKNVHFKEDDLQNVLIETLAGDILKDIRYLKESQGTEKGHQILQNIQITKPSVLRRGQVLIYTTDKDFYIVGSARNIKKFVNECKLEQFEPEPTKVNQKVQVDLKSLTDHDLLTLTKLDLVADVENAVPDVSFSVEKKILQGTYEGVQKAIEVLNKVLKSVAKKEVVFRNPFCAKVFIEDNVKNETLCNFMESKIIKCKKVNIKRCYIAVEAGDIPRVYVYCLNEEAALAAAGIISNCLCMNMVAKDLFERMKGSIHSWFDSGKAYAVYRSEKEVYVVTTSDITEKFNKLLAEKVHISKTVPVLELACRYFNQFGSSLLEKVNADYKVSVNVGENSFTLSGITEHVTKAKHFIKDSYAGECLNVETDISLIEKRKLQFDDVAQKHECCWNAKPNSSNRRGMLKNVQYHASWCQPPTGSKLTIIEGPAADTEFDVLLVFVTDSFFPIVSESSLKEGVTRFIDFASELLSNQKTERSPPGTVGLFPRHMTKGVFKSKEVMYLVVQKSTETQGFKSLPLPADLREIILKLSQSSGIFSIGIPIETDDLKGSFKMAELCNQVTATWMNNWSHQKNMPELFLCAATSTENVLEMVNRSFKTSRGFSKRNFLAVDEGTSDVSNFVHTEVKIGDLLNSKAGVIVNTTASNLDLRDGYISSQILKRAGDSVQEECNRKYPSGIDNAEVAVTGSGNLGNTANVKHILHSSLQKYTCQKHEKAIDCVKRFVRNCLYTAERLDVISIAFPSLGTGKLCYPRRDVAAAMFDAVEEYQKEAINPRLRHIYFMVYGGDETVCKAFQNEEARRLDKHKTLRKQKELGEHDALLKKVLLCGEAPLECKVCLNVQNIPPQFVVVNFSNIASGRETKLTLKSAKDPPSSGNDELISRQEIDGEVQFKKMVKEVVDLTDSDRITGLVFNPLTKSSFKYSIGHQIKLFTEKVEQLGFTDQRKRSLWYLREIWFAVDESGFSSAEHILLSGTLMKSINNWIGDTSWEKIPVSESSDRASINVIGPSRDAVQAAATEIKAILKQENSSNRSQENQHSSTVVFKPGQHKVYTSFGLENQQTPSQHGKPELKKTPPRDESRTGDKRMQTFVSQGARPKQTGASTKSDIVPSGPLKTGADRQDSIDKESSILDTLGVTADINHGITTFLKAKGEDKLTEWTETVTKVFQVRFQKTMDKLTVHGSFFQIKTFQDYLNNDFPKFPEGTKDTEYDESKSPDDTAVESPISAKSEDGIVFHYQFGHVKVFVYKGDLTQVNTGCIVSSASLYLSGNWGLEKAIFDAAGRQVRQDCETYMRQKKHLLPGEAFVSGSGNLKCKKIIHFAMPDSLVSDGELKLYSSFAGCINRAEKERLHSVGIPALGAGTLPASSRLLEKFGGCFYNAVSKHSEEKNPSVKEVHFVDRNTRMVSSVVESLMTKFTCLRINQASIYVAKGSVTATKADAIVVFQDSNFNFNSKIAKDVSELSGDRYNQRLELYKEEIPCIGSVYHSKTTGDMATLCASIIHAVVLENSDADTKKGLPTIFEMKKICKDIFAKCQKLKVATLGVPVFEIDELNNSEYFNAMAEFVFEYFCTRKENSIKEIHFLSEDMNAVRAFAEGLQKQITLVEKLKNENKLAFHSAPKQETEIY